MAGTQSYTPDEMERLGKDVQRKSDELKDLLNKVDRTINELSGVWKDPAFEKFRSEWESMHSKVETFVPQVEEYGKRTVKHADEVRRVGVAG